VERVYSIAAFIRAFNIIGYTVCTNDGFEAGHEKVALYADGNGKPTHMARQLLDGRWTSKLGQNIDITHKDVSCLEGGDYRRVAVYLRRKT
jgi:hypothetical protein